MSIGRPLRRGDFLRPEQVEEIAALALRILEELGIKVASPSMLDALRRRGHTETGGRIRIPREQSRAFLDTLRGDALLRGETEEKRARRGLRGVPGSYALHMEDPRTGAVAPFTTESLTEAAKFTAAAAGSCGNFDAFAPGVPQDVPAPLESLIKYKISALYGAGAIPFEPTSRLAAQYLFPMAEVMGQPVSRLPVYTISPLCLGGESADLVYRFRDRLDSFYVFAMPMLGGTAPLSVTEALAMCLAELLGAGLLMHELTGLRCILRPNIFPMDLQVMNFAYGNPRKFLYECLVEDFTAQLLDLPVNYHSTNIHSNCAVSGVQSAMEKTSLITGGALLGATRFYCVGTLSLDEVFSPAELLLDSLRIRQAEEMVEGLAPEPTDQTAALEELAEYIDTGFVMSDRTLDEHMAYVNYAPLINRNGHSAFAGGNNSEMLEEARAQASRLLEEECPPTATKEQAAELERLYEAAAGECGAM